MASNSRELDGIDRAYVGAVLRQYREMRGHKPDELANQVGISRPYLANIEAGRKRLTPVLVAKLAAALNVPQGALVPPGYFDAEQVPA